MEVEEAKKMSGQQQMELLITKQDMGYFDSIERKFINGLKGRKYNSLTSHEKIVVFRLIGWMTGH